MDDPESPGSSLLGAVMNSSRTKDEGSAGSSRDQLLLEVLVVLMCVFAVAGNALVIAIVAATKAFHTLSSVLIVNLAISDLLVGIGVMPMVALSIMNRDWAESTSLCLYVGYTSCVYCTASVLTLAVIALDRYHSIVDCLTYRSFSTLRRTATTILWIWLQALVINCPPLAGWCSLSYIEPIYNCGVNWAGSPGYTVCVAVLSYLVPATAILFCYASIIRVARSHVRRIHSLADSVNRLPTGDSSPKLPGSLQDPAGPVWHVSGQFEAARQANSAPPESVLASSSSLATLQNCQQPQNYHGGVVRLLLVIAAFFICWTPYVVVAFVQTVETAVSGQSNLVPPAVLTSSYFLVLLTSVINPLLYALLSRRFRVALRELVHRMRERLSSASGRGGQTRTGGKSKRRYRSTLFSNLPRSSSSSETLTTDDAKCCAPVFTITDVKNTSREHLCDVYSREEASQPSSTCEDSDRTVKVNYLYVPPSPQEGSRLPFSALTKERQATFYFGVVTVRVEHDVC